MNLEFIFPLFGVMLLLEKDDDESNFDQHRFVGDRG